MTPWIRNTLAFRQSADLARVREILAPWTQAAPWSLKGLGLDGDRPRIILRSEWCPARDVAEALSRAFPGIDLELVYEDAMSGAEGAEAYRGGELRQVLYFDERTPLRLPA